MLSMLILEFMKMKKYSAGSLILMIFWSRFSNFHTLHNIFQKRVCPACDTCYQIQIQIRVFVRWAQKSVFITEKIRNTHNNWEKKVYPINRVQFSLLSLLCFVLFLTLNALSWNESTVTVTPTVCLTPIDFASAQNNHFASFRCIWRAYLLLLFLFSLFTPLLSSRSFFLLYIHVYFLFFS
jgi:hypothetical protein